MSERWRAAESAGITAVLGPTNTGKTHLAVERMLAHRTGTIGLPLRLLAREIYERVVAAKGARNVALLTGEEKIVPPHATHFVCTVESMPLDRRAEFLAVDEIQLCADPERGHVFTDRLLRARGERETMFLGAATMRPLLRQLLPEAQFISRPRFSRLSYAGERKLSRLPRRSVVVAFSAAEVYALAELMRRQRGGAAVVLGALSPRTRNAQVALYQSGEVDYLVATDAIGMGLNMSVDHVAFAQRRKFDGRTTRDLAAAELAQIAGRAGRHMNDGTFGVTAGLEPFEPDQVEMIENHRFDPIRQLHWRNSALDFRSLDRLLRSLAAPPPGPGLARAREAVDQVALRALAEDPEAGPLVAGPAAVKRLWEVCQIPDFRKASADSHHRLLKRIYLHLMSSQAVLPVDWVAEQVNRLDRTDGDIDTLSTRIAYVRTWAYIAHRADWVADARHWRERAREIEDRLSDALHEALTQRFVDRRTAALVRGLRSGRELVSSVSAAGEVLVEGQFVGRLQGLRFKADVAEAGSDSRAMRTAANRILAHETAKRADALAGAAEAEIEWRDDNRLWWGGAPVASLGPGPDMLRPAVQVLPAEHLSGPQRERVRRRLADWLEGRIAASLAPLLRLREAALSGPARGLCFQLVEAMGSAPRPPLEPLIRALAPDDRRALRRLGVRLGYLDVFVPATLKPAARALRARLWSASRQQAPAESPPANAVAVPLEGRAPEFLQALGFRPAGPLAVRADVLDRLVGLARKAAEAGGGAFAPDPAMASLLARGAEDLAAVLQAAGFRRDGERLRLGPRPGGRDRRPAPAPGGAFAELARLKAAGA